MTWLAEQHREPTSLLSVRRGSIFESFFSRGVYGGSADNVQCPNFAVHVVTGLKKTNSVFNL